MEKAYTFESQFIRYTDTEFDGKKLHSFQLALMNIHQQEEDCLIINAPTGAGKTYGFGLPTLSSEAGISGRSKTLIISPTNALIKQTWNDLGEVWSKRISVNSFSAKDIRETGLKRPQKMFERIREHDITVTNPDLISLLVAGFYYRYVDNTRLRQWSDIFKNVSTIIFDEYHLYSEEELAKMLCFIALAKGTGNTAIKNAFASATPNEKLKPLLGRFGFSYREMVEEMQGGRGGNERYRPTKGKVNLVFTDRNILDSIEEEIPHKGRTLFLFDRVVGCERGIEKLKSLGVNETDWKEYTGFETKAIKKHNEIADENAPYIMATCAAEQGLNMEVDIAHIEPGMFLENFWQRFGRAARRGREGTVIVHTEPVKIKHLPPNINGYKELGEVMENLMTEKTTYASKVFNHAGAYLYLIWKKAGNNALKDQVWTVGMEQVKKGTITFLKFHKMEKQIDKLNRTARRGAKRDSNDLKKWWLDYLQAFGWFRGQSESIKVILPRSDRKETETDIRWLKKWCEYTSTQENEITIYDVGEYRTSPRELIMKYSGPQGPEQFVKESVWQREAMIERWKKILEEFLDDAFDEEEELEDIVDEMNNLLPYILSPIHKTLLKPVEVNEVANDPFL